MSAQCCPAAIDHPIQIGYNTPFFAIRPITRFTHSTSGVFHNRETCRFNVYWKCFHSYQVLSEIIPHSIGLATLMTSQSILPFTIAGGKIDFTRGFSLSCFISDYFSAQSSRSAAAQLIADSCSFLRKTLTWIRKALVIYHWHDNIPHIYHKFVGKSACQTFVQHVINSNLIKWHCSNSSLYILTLAYFLLLATITLHHITLIRQYLQITLLRYIKLIICMKISFTFFKIKTLYFHIVFYYQFLFMRIITAVQITAKFLSARH